MCAACRWNKIKDNNIDRKASSSSRTNTSSDSSSAASSSSFADRTGDMMTPDMYQYRTTNGVKLDQIVKEDMLIFDFDSNLDRLLKVVRDSKLLKPQVVRGITFYTPLQLLSIGLSKLFNELNYMKKEEVVITDSLDFRGFLYFGVKASNALAEALRYSAEFMQLPPNDREVLFRRIYPVFINLERLYSSIQIFGSESKEIKIFFDDTQAFGPNFAALSSSDFPDAEAKNIFNIYKDCNKFLLESLYLPLKEIAIDQTEFAFLIASYMFSLEDSSEVEAETKTMGKRILESLNNEMYQYYVYTKGLPNFAYRITEISKLLAKAARYASLKKEVVAAAKFFDIYKRDTFLNKGFEIDSPGFMFILGS
uniref:NR LBD domain-containing protein n=1 Tax=Rhabditophanes sp. KR3021 TaxID=114890 RepID=A0AC35UBV3_9BILA